MNRDEDKLISDSVLLEEILKQVVLEPIRESVIPLQNSIHSLIKDMKFLFKDDEGETKKVLLENCFDENLEGNQNTIPLRNTINKLSKDFKFLFGDDEDLTKKILVRACFSLNLEENEIDYAYIIAHIPENIKKSIIEKTVSKMMKKFFKVDDLR